MSKNRRQMQKRNRQEQTHKMTVGKGSDAKIDDLPEIVEMNSKAILLMQLQGYVQMGTRHYVMGDCSILVSPPTETSGYHMSISTDYRLPTWAEVVKARYELIPDEVNMGMMLPSKEDYINIHEFCFQLVECEAKI